MATEEHPSPRATRWRPRGRPAARSTTTDSVVAGTEATGRLRSVLPVTALALVLWTALAVYTGTVQNAYEYTSQPEGKISNSSALAVIDLVIVALVALWAVLRPERARHAAPWLIVLAIVGIAWQVLTAKTGILHPPYWPAPQTLLRHLVDERAILLRSVWASAKLLALGFALGGAAGFALGVSMGWSQRVHYWANPLLKTFGPVPAVALIPAAFAILPSAHAASVLLIALSAGFPIAVLTFSGVAGVARPYYDVAVTLGASPRFLVWKVAIPAALPSVFVGLFMSLGAVFPTLVVSEQLGAKAGLGWYLQWQQQWSAYPKMYVVLLVMVVLFSGLIALVFRIRDHVLSWQRGLVRW
ncbi:ABC transporter permease subunit [Patulibacter sp. NPDC049589]|uniref:ABC transporter permease n=1 Tax=Patulibacter sp. NPDC049589 TaxID=3154731 RepID=UPI00341E6441